MKIAWGMFIESFNYAYRTTFKRKEKRGSERGKKRKSEI